MVIAPASSSEVHAIRGRVYGGEQPLAGATIQLYAAGMPSTGGGYGLGSTALITGTLPTTDVNGNFNITGDYTLPSSPSFLYLVATGGSPGSGNPANDDVTLMAVIGGCTASTVLSSSLFININEVTTIASVLALQPFLAAPLAGNVGAPAIGGPASAFNALQNAFETAGNLASISTGSSLTHAQDYATTDYNGQLVNSLADVLVYCVNSDPTVANACSTLFSTTTPSSAGFAANDTLQAAWYIAQNPTNNVAAIFNLISSMPAFVGLTTAPADFTYAVATSASACQAAIPLASAGNYAVLGGNAVTNTSSTADQTIIAGGDVGVSPGTAVTGFVTGTYTATIDNPDAAAAQLDLTTAYNAAAGLLSGAVLPTDISGITFTPGLYTTASSVTLNTGIVTLDAQGDSNAVFVFQTGSTIVAAASTQVVLANGAQAQNVFWQVGSSMTIGSSAVWVGNIMAYTSVTLGTDATLVGRALASNGAVTLLSNVIAAP